MHIQQFKVLALFASLVFLPSLPLHSKDAYNPQNPCDVFSNIYNTGEWGRNSQGEGTSGSGSLPANALPYLEMLQEFLVKFQIQSVVDVGCGDWELSKMINWGSIDYYGYDAADTVIEKNIRRYGNSKRTFIACDAVHADLPQADLLICKDVLQHLPNSFIQDFITQLGKFKYCLITNDIDFDPIYDRRLNLDIPMGLGRCVDLTKPPFNVVGIPFIRYVSNGRYPTDSHIKEVLLIVREPT